MYKGKKLLVLGGKPIGSVELVERAKDLGAYVIVTDYLSEEESPAKRIADESWNISTSEIDELAAKCIEVGVTGISTAVHEYNINRMIDLCEKLDLPCYCKRNTWVYCDNKLSFKALCQKNSIPVAKKYDIDINDDSALISINYPVIVKPVDGSGSRGFRVCEDMNSLKSGYNNALQFSPTKSVIIEDYVPYNAVIIHYTMVNGKCYFSGISDKYSSKFASTGASVMGLQIFPSTGLSIYLEKLDEKVRQMFENACFTDGPIWIEAFYDGNDKFVFNEMGYRFGGSLTYYPVRYFYAIEQLDLMLAVALNGENVIKISDVNPKNKYCILPIHVNAGTIKNIYGMDEIISMNEVYAYVPVHFNGDVIQNWGSAQQVFCYLHVTFDTMNNLRSTIKTVMSKLKAVDENGDNMLFTLFNIENII